MKNKAFFSGMV